MIERKGGCVTGFNAASDIFMIVDENIIKYMYSLEKDAPEFFEELREYALENDVPIIRREMESFIRVLLDIIRPARILEIGAGIGYSGCFMALCLEEAGISDYELITVENYPPRIEKAREVISRSGFSGHITLLEDDAENAVKELSGTFDLIFLDAAKGQYITFLPYLLKLMKKGSALLADNVLQEGELIRSRYITPRRERTIHERMREFIWQVKHSSELDTTLIPIGDGVTLSIKK